MLLLSARGVGAIEFLRSTLPEVVLGALALLTWLGSAPLLLGLIAVVYWYESREGGAFALAAVLGGFALTIALKAALGLPRPPDSVWLVGTSGYGFPSGHAIAATVGWGSLALALDRGTRRDRIAVVAIVVAVVSLSRVALGVHYAVDVVAGVAVGGTYLGVVRGLDDPERIFGAATGLALLAVVVTGGGDDALLLFGAATGSWLVWSRFSVPVTSWGRSRAIPGAVGAFVLGSVLLLGYRASLPLPAPFVIGAVAFSGLLALPVLVDRFSDRI